METSFLPSRKTRLEEKTSQTVETQGRGSKPALCHIDANGNLTNDGNGKVYTYDAVNRMTSVTQTVSGVQTVTGFVYDGWSHRVQETSNGTVVKQWVWCLPDTQPCEERDGSGNVTKRFYDQGEQINGTNYFVTKDHLGSVREMTDSTGNLVARYDYDPFGRRTLVSGTDLADFGFTGYYRDQATHLDLPWIRAYDANLGRWLSRDPLPDSELHEGLNLYRYVANDPVNAVDPFGLCKDFKQCWQNCMRQNGAEWALGVLGVTLPFASIPVPGKQILGSQNPYTSIVSIVLRSIGASVAKSWWRRLNPYANVVAAGAAAYLTGLSINCACQCNSDVNSW